MALLPFRWAVCARAGVVLPPCPESAGLPRGTSPRDFPTGFPHRTSPWDFPRVQRGPPVHFCQSHEPLLYFCACLLLRPGQGHAPIIRTWLRRKQKVESRRPLRSAARTFTFSRCTASPRSPPPPLPLQLQLPLAQPSMPSVRRRSPSIARAPPRTAPSLRLRQRSQPPKPPLHPSTPRPAAVPPVTLPVLLPASSVPPAAARQATALSRPVPGAPWRLATSMTRPCRHTTATGQHPCRLTDPAMSPWCLRTQCPISTATAAAAPMITSPCRTTGTPMSGWASHHVRKMPSTRTSSRGWCPSAARAPRTPVLLADAVATSLWTRPTLPSWPRTSLGSASTFRSWRASLKPERTTVAPCCAGQALMRTRCALSQGLETPPSTGTSGATSTTASTGRPHFVSSGSMQSCRPPS
eukprot:m.96785 g.96785  ORF g.96785 m.96785 type:complete len:411 (+) comp8804_c0_seq1:832-2064(+)